MGNIRLIAIDIDGTLIDDNLKVSDNTIKIIKELKKRNIEIVLVTGRAHAGAKKIMDQIGISLPIISHNGGKVVLANGREIKNTKFPIQAVKEVLDYSEANRLYTIVYIDDMFYASIDNEINDRTAQKLGVEYRIIDNFIEDIIEEINLLLVYFKKEITKKELDKFKDLDVEITTSIPKAVEFIPKGISKAEGLKELKNHLNIKKENIMAIGNSLNDLSMLEFAGTGIAMKNSDSLLLENYENVSEFTNNEEGVYKILKKILIK